jgi:hypothetical protein
MFDFGHFSPQLAYDAELVPEACRKLKLRGPATSTVKQSNNAHQLTFYAVGNNIWSTLYDQLSRAIHSTRAAHLGKVGKLFNSTRDNV